VWMSSGVLDHKRQGQQTQTWPVGILPDAYGDSAGPHRLFVAVNGRWRGFFVLESILCCLEDIKRPYTLAFNPGSWKSVEPAPAPSRDRKLGYTTATPAVAPQRGERNPGTKSKASS